MKSCSVITQSILFNITGIVFLFLFYFLKKIYDLTVSMVLEIVYQK